MLHLHALYQRDPRHLLASLCSWLILAHSLVLSDTEYGIYRIHLFIIHFWRTPFNGAKLNPLQPCHTILNCICQQYLLCPTVHYHLCFFICFGCGITTSMFGFLEKINLVSWAWRVSTSTINCWFSTFLLWLDARTHHKCRDQPVGQWCR